LLSALAFHFQTRLDAEPLAGGSGESDLLHPYGAQAPADTVGAYLAPAPREIVVEDDAQLRLALAVNREALNASSPFYAFLAYWNVLEVVFDADGAKRNNFLRQEVANTYQRPTFVAGQDIATYLRDESRHAIAHVIRTSPTDTAIDPDLPLDRGRLEKDRSLMREFAHKATLSRWRRPVTLLDGED
jgi:hypothetical protein